MKQNDGNLYIFPQQSATDTTCTSGDYMRLGNMKYFNYALSQNDIEKQYKSGPPTYKVPENDNEIKRIPAYINNLSAYSMDIYN